MTDRQGIPKTMTIHREAPSCCTCAAHTMSEDEWCTTQKGYGPNGTCENYRPKPIILRDCSKCSAKDDRSVCPKNCDGVNFE